jgi:hypothetical protein
VIPKQVEKDPDFKIYLLEVKASITISDLFQGGCERHGRVIQSQTQSHHESEVFLCCVPSEPEQFGRVQGLGISISISWVPVMC